MSIPLWSGPMPHAAEGDGFVPFMEIFRAGVDRLATPCVVIFPGGGYAKHGEIEARPVAQKFRELGFDAVIVYYRVSPHRHPAPLADAARAFRLLRANAAEWGIGGKMLVACGFSAGGHLAAALAVHHDKDFASAADPLSEISARPDGVILGYSVLVDHDGVTHEDSFRNLLGTDPGGLGKLWMSLERHITPSTPPAFIWHTSADESVSASHSLIFAHRLRMNKVPFEMHIFSEGHGRHGLGLAVDVESIAEWPVLASRWLRKIAEKIS